MKNLFIILTLLFSHLLKADVLIIQRIENTHSIEVPTKGMSMNQVIKQFGQPLLKKEPIGSPPITKWKYSNFTVYFERSWTISSVINKASKNEVGPKIILQ